MSWLPVWEDTDEAPHVYGYLCDLIDNNHPLVLGPNNANLPRLMVIFSEVSYEMNIVTYFNKAAPWFSD